MTRFVASPTSLIVRYADFLEIGNSQNYPHLSDQQRAMLSDTAQRMFQASGMKILEQYGSQVYVQAHKAALALIEQRKEFRKRSIDAKRARDAERLREQDEFSREWEANNV